MRYIILLTPLKDCKTTKKFEYHLKIKFAKRNIKTKNSSTFNEQTITRISIL